MIAVLSGLAAFGLALGMGWVWLANAQVSTIERHLRSHWGTDTAEDGLLQVARRAVALTPPGQWLERKLADAHLRLAAADVMVVGLVLWLVLLKAATGMLGLTTLNAGVLATVALIGAARIFLNTRRGWLVRTFNEQMPDVAWMMGNAMRAGLTIPQGMALVAREAPTPAGAVFQEMLARISLNHPLSDVLSEAQVQWAESREFRLFVLTVLIQHRAGGNLAGALEELSRTLAERKGINEEVRSATAGPRSAALMLPFMPLIAAGVMNLAIPGFLNPLFTPVGLVVAIPAAVLMYVAMVAIRQASRIEV